MPYKTPESKIYLGRQDTGIQKLSGVQDAGIQDSGVQDLSWTSRHRHPKIIRRPRRRSPRFILDVYLFTISFFSEHRKHFFDGLKKDLIKYYLNDDI
jgi:hypothetical protein